MSKRMLRDILPPPERSIRKIPLPPKSDRDDLKEEVAKRKEEILNYPPGNKKNKSGYLGFLIAAIVLILFFTTPLVWSSAEIKIKTRTASHDFNKNLTASKESDGFSIPFDTLSLTKELERELPAVRQEEVKRKASGEIIIFNKYSQTSQNLIKNTRFETPEGLVYRINESITVPGATLKDSVLTPGQIKVRVYADFPGPEYNIGLTDFTIPGFKDLPQFDDFFAASVTEMTGGFIGKVGVSDEEESEKTVAELRSKLDEEIKRGVSEQIPDSSILIPESLSIEFESLPQKNLNETSVVIIEKAVISGIILNKNFLEAEIIRDVIESDTKGIIISNLEEFNFSIPDIEIIHIESLEELKFNMSGNAELIWTINEEDLKNDLAGISKKKLGEILSSKYPSVLEATSSIKPFWKRSFPKNTERIKILLNN